MPSYSPPTPTPTPGFAPTPTPTPTPQPTPGLGEDNPTPAADNLQPDPVLTLDESGEAQLLSTALENGVPNPFATNTDGWSSGSPDGIFVDPSWAIDLPNHITGGPMDPYTGTTASDQNLNAYTGGESVNPFTGQGATSTDTSQWLASNDVSVEQGLASGRVTTRYVGTDPNSGVDQYAVYVDAKFVTFIYGAASGSPATVSAPTAGSSAPPAPTASETPAPVGSSNEFGPAKTFPPLPPSPLPPLPPSVGNMAQQLPSRSQDSASNSTLPTPTPQPASVQSNTSTSSPGDAPARPASSSDWTPSSYPRADGTAMSLQLAPLALPVRSALPPISLGPSQLQQARGYSISPPPPIRPTEEPFSTGILWQQYTGALREATDPSTPLWAKGVLYLSAGLASLVANAEEGTRQVANSVATWGIDAGQHVGRALQWSDQGETAQAIGEYSTAIANDAAAFDSVGLYVESMIQNGATQSTLRGLSRWWSTGSENDAAWRALSWRDKLNYEVGQNTTSATTYQQFSGLNPVERGQALFSDQGISAIFSNYANLLSTMQTGPTPGVRWAAPYIGAFLYVLGFQLEAYSFGQGVQ
jgi:hypothetical protein